jgi:hypothetical protein
MSKTRILTFVFLFTAIGAAFYLYWTINRTITETARIEAAEKVVIKKLMLIREAQQAYLAVNGQYTSDWDALVDFVKNGKFTLTQRTETIVEEAYGVDKVTVKIDTLGSVRVLDSLFNQKKYPGFNPDDLPYVPNVEPKAKFLVWAEKAERSGVMVDLIEVIDPKPINPDRDETNDQRKKKPLRFGSRSSVTVNGNWE